MGAAINQARATLEGALEARRSELESAARRARLGAERLDLTEVPPADGVGHLHLVTQAMERLEDVFVGMGFTVAEGPEVETDWHNFGALNFPPDHPARDMYDTLYVELGEPGSTVLRTHTSPVQVRVMDVAAPADLHGDAGPGVPPGHARRHAHAGVPPDRGPGDRPGHHVRATWPAPSTPSPRRTSAATSRSRLRPSYFPFTEPSAEFDIRRPDGSWLELGGCGMVHPNVLAQLRHRSRGVAGLRLRLRHRPPGASAPRRRPTCATCSPTTSASSSSSDLGFAP